MMLSSRFSGKSYQVEHLIVLLLSQKRARVVINFVRSRNSQSTDTQKTIFKLLQSYQGGNGVTCNLSDGTITLFGNTLRFRTLNEEKEKVEKTGGKIGLNIEYDAEYIVTVFEECSQLHKELVENMTHSVRGSVYTHYLFIYLSNPWLRTHWFCDEFIKHLPENKQAEDELLSKGYNMKFDERTKTLYYRPRYTLNSQLKPEQIQEIEALKEMNYNKWRIVSLGFTGNLRGSLYEASLKYLRPAERHLGVEYVGGIDWGDGKSAGGSATVAYFGSISIDTGIDILAEFEHWNNRGVVLSTEKQLEKIADFFIDKYHLVQEHITVYIDNAALGDFYLMLQQAFGRKGISPNQIEVLPAFKPKNTWERVETINALICYGVLRYNKDTCKGLYQSMENCYEVIKPSPTENGKRERSHEWTHWLHALEYLVGTYMKEFQDRLPQSQIMFSKTNGSSATY